MEVKQKAEKLILKFLRVDNNTKEWLNIYIAKQMAIIEVDEILEECSQLKVEFWKNVRSEIHSYCG